jgi:hypothetical protein
MATKTAQDIDGFEYDWVATDRDGHVALFTTAGGGYAPKQFLLDVDAHDAAIAALLGAPATTDALFAPVLGAGLDNTWKFIAERGIYAFDSDPNGGPYRLVSAPRRAVKLAELPPLVSRIAVVLDVCVGSRDELSSSELASAVVEPREHV